MRAATLYLAYISCYRLKHSVLEMQLGSEVWNNMIPLLTIDHVGWYHCLLPEMCDSCFILTYVAGNVSAQSLTLEDSTI